MCNDEKYLNKYKKKLCTEVAANEFYSDMLRDIKEVYQKLCCKPIKVLSYSYWKIFYESGSRAEYEGMYFSRRGELCCCAILYLIYNDKKYLDRLEDVIWAVCDEYSWALPAHLKEEDSVEYQQIYIDIFAAETAQTLSEIYNLLVDELSVLIKRRIKKEMNRRIFDSFESQRFFWDSITNNWAPVCAGCVGMAYMYMAPERFKVSENRILGIMNNYLSGYGDDGICSEGLSYWNYGFGYYVYFADMLYEFTNGKTDILKYDKIKNIACFQQNVFIRKNITASFSDSAMTEKYSPALTCYLAKRFNEVVIPKAEYAKLPSEDTCFRFATIIRGFAWTEPINTKASQPHETMNYFKSYNWYINRRERYSFALKGGNNAESHNHNDLGSFIIADDSGQLLADIGGGEYTKDYFDDAKRYNYLCNASFGHSVPIIDGGGQLTGKECSAFITAYDKNSVELEIKNAYKTQTVIKRKFYFDKACVKIDDEYSFADRERHDIQERFISIIKPEIINKSVKIGGSIITCSMIPNISSKTIKDHKSKDLIVYFTDYSVYSNSFSAEICFD